MKKIFLLLFFTALPSYAILPPDAAIIHVHDMQMLNQQKFRMEEINDYNDVQQEKIRYEKRNSHQQTVINKIFNKKSKFIEDNGEIKIKNDGN